MVKQILDVNSMKIIVKKNLNIISFLKLIIIFKNNNFKYILINTT